MRRACARVWCRSCAVQNRELSSPIYPLLQQLYYFFSCTYICFSRWLVVFLFRVSFFPDFVFLIRCCRFSFCGLCFSSVSIFSVVCEIVQP